MPGHAWRSRLPDYPSDHKLGMRVPLGGSNCAKCEYVDTTAHDGEAQIQPLMRIRTTGHCKEKHFIEWNGDSKIPGDIQAYCCDFFST